MCRNCFSLSPNRKQTSRPARGRLGNVTPEGSSFPRRELIESETDEASGGPYFPAIHLTRLTLTAPSSAGGALDPAVT